MKRRFFFHYYRQFGCMSIHWGKTCYKVKEIDCRVPCETKWRNRQPNLIMQGYAHSVVIDGEKAVIH